MSEIPNHGAGSVECSGCGVVGDLGVRADVAEGELDGDAVLVERGDGGRAGGRSRQAPAFHGFHSFGVGKSDDHAPPGVVGQRINRADFQVFTLGYHDADSKGTGLHRVGEEDVGDHDAG